eukprot:CAMPEP_0181176574 /NCGR_PEP_ID=MMETSP1096-20121128/4702_1 /TAXON_ID=156174 ORGANISM="Chrysochromulina ericina, Strain CCMP281" /NCGR_SAMPLE_ID=MMETSP1096 /ASSEMBLY_ACC=CAM_ASM_000453 /LENGTH=228 /DNA_ID=CAMNT_0023264671 /DNA_START=257 /DNA_END=944 /DNA_ORIENTATION=-
MRLGVIAIPRASRPALVGTVTPGAPVAHPSASRPMGVGGPTARRPARHPPVAVSVSPTGAGGDAGKRSQSAEKPAAIARRAVGPLWAVALKKDAADDSGGHLCQEDEGRSGAGKCPFPADGRNEHRVGVGAWIVEGISHGEDEDEEYDSGQRGADEGEDEGESAAMDSPTSDNGEVGDGSKARDKEGGQQQVEQRVDRIDGALGHSGAETPQHELWVDPAIQIPQHGT